MILFAQTQNCDLEASWSLILVKRCFSDRICLETATTFPDSINPSMMAVVPDRSNSDAMMAAPMTMPEYKCAAQIMQGSITKKDLFDNQTFQPLD
jgi:hypothetical protein